MAQVPSIYKSPAVKAEIMALYDAKLKACTIAYEECYVDTFAGSTHVIVAGPADKPPVVLLHGINAGAPLALEAMRDLTDRYRIYAVDRRPTWVVLSRGRARLLSIRRCSSRTSRRLISLRIPAAVS